MRMLGSALAFLFARIEDSDGEKWGSAVGDCEGDNCWTRICVLWVEVKEKVAASCSESTSF